jgi:hypothetical protein
MQIIASAILMAMLAAVAAGCSGEEAQETTSTSAVTTLPSEQAHLGSGPRACGRPKPEVVPIDSPLAEALGSSPVWFAVEGALLDPEGRIFYLSRDTPHTSAGWELLTVWVFDAEQQEPVTVTGEDLSEERGAIRFAPRGSDEPPTPELVLDPNAATPAGRFLQQEVLVYIERGSCFRIDAAAGDESGRFIVGMGL